VCWSAIASLVRSLAGRANNWERDGLDNVENPRTHTGAWATNDSGAEADWRPGVLGLRVDLFVDRTDQHACNRVAGGPVLHYNYDGRSQWLNWQASWRKPLGGEGVWPATSAPESRQTTSRVARGSGSRLRCARCLQHRSCTTGDHGGRPARSRRSHARSDSAASARPIARRRRLTGWGSIAMNPRGRRTSAVRRSGPRTTSTSRQFHRQTAAATGSVRAARIDSLPCRAGRPSPNLHRHIVGDEAREPGHARHPGQFRLPAGALAASATPQAALESGAPRCR